MKPESLKSLVCYGAIFEHIQKVIVAGGRELQIRESISTRDEHPLEVDDRRKVKVLNIQLVE